ncbi:MAG: class I SAM-dependent methyltransferase [Vicinamibacterales bacterium]
MARLRAAIASLLFQTGRIADRMSRTTVYLGAGARRLAEMREDHRYAWDAYYERHSAPESSLLSWEEDCLGQFTAPGVRVLVIGCGSGRDLMALAERGCEVTGMDPSGTGLDIADRLLRGRGFSAKLIQGFFEDTPIARPFDVVVFSYYCYAAIPMTSRRIGALAKAASLVDAGGHVIVSHAAGIPRPHSILVRLGQIAGALARSDWRLEPGDLVSDNRERAASFSFTHAFEPGELEREATAAGLRPVFRRVADDRTIVAVFART